MQVNPEQISELELLIQLNDSNPTTKALLFPDYEKIFNIDLDSRIIENPDIITIDKDHNAETIYFKTNRFFDNMDLASTNCVIFFKNASNKTLVYPVPYIDVDTLEFADGEEVLDNPKIIFPWRLSGNVSDSSGVVEFKIVFFRIDDGHMTFKLNTLPSKLTIHKTLEVKDDKYLIDNKAKKEISEWEDFLENYNRLRETGGIVFWKIL